MKSTSYLLETSLCSTCTSSSYVLMTLLGLFLPILLVGGQLLDISVELTGASSVSTAIGYEDYSRRFFELLSIPKPAPRRKCTAESQ
jgi:hypothetical protein